MASTSTPKKKRQARNELSRDEKVKKSPKTFVSSWLDDPEFKGWLAPLPDNPQKCKCMPCNVVILCGRSELQKHASGKKHSENVKSVKNCCNVATFFKPVPSKIDIDVKKAEIKMSSFFAEHNVAFHTADHLIPLLKECFPDSKIAKGMQLKRQKCVQIVKNVIGKEERDEIIDVIRKNNFSILVDESTDISDKKSLCLLVRFVCPVSGLVQTRLLELISVDARDSSAVKLYEAVKNCLIEKDIPLENIIGLACDGANVMIGQHNSLFSHLKSDVPHLVLMKCICHTSALVASKCSKELPDFVEKIVSKISTYVNGSPRRNAILTEVQDLFEEKRRKMLKLSITRWLCFYDCISRIVDNYDVLQTFFALAVGEGDKTAKSILEILEDKRTKAYLLFLKYVLNKLNKFNALFQGRNVLIHKIVSSSKQLLKEFCIDYMKLNVIDQVETVNVCYPGNFKELGMIYLGPDCESFLKTLPQEIANEIRKKCLGYYVAGAKDMQERLPLRNNLLQELRFIDPIIALDGTGRESLQGFPCLRVAFNNFINFDEAEIEWQRLLIIDNEKKVHLKTQPLDEMWQEISLITDFTDALLFKNISALARLAMTMPHSNAEAERIFSIVTDVKTKKRNRIGAEALNAVCVIRSSFQSKNIDCTSFKVEQKHIDGHNSQNLYCNN